MTAAPASRKGRYVVMGVSGCGKSTIGRALADRLDLTFLDGDDLHPASNIEKMRRGEPLDDADRAPWLDLVGARLEPGAVIACSALKRAYRDRIRRTAGDPVVFVYLRGSRETLAQRMRERTGHFMPYSLLESQLATLEEPARDEIAVAADIDGEEDTIVERIAAWIAEPDRTYPGNGPG